MNREAASLPPAAALWALSRPRLAPFVMMLPLVGYGWAHWDRALTAQQPASLLLVSLAWGLLSAGTLWLNANLDRDEGEVLLGRAVQPPPGIVAAGYTALLASVLLASLAAPLAGLAALSCAALAVAYSHPTLAWKGHPIGGPAVNLLGYGLLSPLAGWAVVGVAPNPRTLLMWPVCGFGVLAAYFVAQAFQGPEDRARGYRTLVATHGPGVTLTAARLCVAAGYAICGALALAGWLPRLCLIGLLTWPWVDRWLADWSRDPTGGHSGWATGFAWRLLRAGLVVLACVTVDHLRAIHSGGPVAGLATAAGRPTDRPALPPRELLRWEQQGRRDASAATPTP